MEQGEAIEKMVDLFKRFPGIGQRQAERFARFIAQQDAQYIRRLTEHIEMLHAASRQCPRCFIRHQQDSDVCPLCVRGSTDTLIVVEKDVDAYALSSSDGTLQAYYFVLGGLIPIANSDYTRARVPQLIASVRTHQPSEIIIALSVHPDADHTARSLSAALRKEFPDTVITALGRGLSSGSELEYSDPETLQNALENRSPAS